MGGILSPAAEGKLGDAAASIIEGKLAAATAITTVHDLQQQLSSPLVLAAAVKQYGSMANREGSHFPGLTGAGDFIEVGDRHLLELGTRIEQRISQMVTTNDLSAQISGVSQTLAQIGSNAVQTGNRIENNVRQLVQEVEALSQLAVHNARL